MEMPAPVKRAFIVGGCWANSSLRMFAHPGAQVVLSRYRIDSIFLLRGLTFALPLNAPTCRIFHLAAAAQFGERCARCRYLDPKLLANLLSAPVLIGMRL